MKGGIKDLPANYIPECPFKAGKLSPLRRLPGGNNPNTIRVDPAHTWAIAGIGKDLCSGAIVVQARMGIFGLGAMSKRLDRAYEQFDAYLNRVGKHSSIEDFHHQTLKCGKSCLCIMMKPKMPRPKSC